MAYRQAFSVRVGARAGYLCLHSALTTYLNTKNLQGAMRCWQSTGIGVLFSMVLQVGASGASKVTGQQWRTMPGSACSLQLLFVLPGKPHLANLCRNGVPVRHAQDARGCPQATVTLGCGIKQQAQNILSGGGLFAAPVCISCHAC